MVNFTCAFYYVTLMYNTNNDLLSLALKNEGLALFCLHRSTEEYRQDGGRVHKGCVQAAAGEARRDGEEDREVV